MLRLVESILHLPHLLTHRGLIFVQGLVLPLAEREKAVLEQTVIKSQMDMSADKVSFCACVTALTDEFDYI